MSSIRLTPPQRAESLEDIPTFMIRMNVVLALIGGRQPLDLLRLALARGAVRWENRFSMNPGTYVVVRNRKRLWKYIQEYRAMEVLRLLAIAEEEEP